MIDKPRNDRPGKGPSARAFSSAKKPFRAAPSEGGESRKKPFKHEPLPGGIPPGTVAKRPDEAQRIAKVMARAGLCSRRDAEMWIEQGRVEVNGVQLTSPAFNVEPGDKIVVDGVKMASRERTRLFAFHKPRGFVTTDRDPEGRPTIFDHLATVVPVNAPDGLPRTVTIGRLDINTEGLLLLTNDGGLARVLELPSTGWLRRYRVRANGETDQSVLDTLRDGITIDGVDYMGIEAHLDRVQGANVWLTMGLREGKNREIKRVLEHLGLAVTRLIRISFGPFQLGELEEGGVEEIKTRILRDQLGDKLAAEAGADFDSPVAGEQAPLRATPPSRKTLAAVKPDVRERPAPAGRKHVSALRADKDKAQTSGARTRIERGGTEDRKGRAVKVERVVAAKRPGKFEDVPMNRNARRFDKESRPPRENKDGPRKFKPREKNNDGPRTFKPRGDKPAGERPQRASFRDGLETRRGERGGSDPRRMDRPRRGDLVDAPREDKPPRRYDNKDRAPRGDGERAPRKFGDKPAGGGAREGGFKGARKFTPGGKPFTDRGPPKGPRGDKPAGGRPPRGKS